MFSLFKTFLVLGAILLVVQPAQAWWDQGHILVSKIAEDNLDPKTQETLNAILAAHPDYSVQSLSDASLWPDLIKNREHPFHRESRSTWHYKNRPIGVSLLSGPPQGELVKQLVIQTQILSDTSVPLENRAVALCWVVHLVGDIHQPLHNTALYSHEFPLGDQGGNRFEVRLGQNKISLHAQLDSVGGRFLYPVPSYRLESYRNWFQTRYPSSSWIEEISNLDFQAWSDAGLALARSQVYQELEPNDHLKKDKLQTILDLTERQITPVSYTHLTLPTTPYV